MQTQASKQLSEALRPRVMSQSELAKKLGVSPQSVSKWVSGASKPTDDLRVQLRDLVGIPLEAWTEAAGEGDGGEAA